MRIISGIYKGRRIDGKVPSNVRPTQDALRETMFNIISNHFDFEDKVVCDLCCGTGALGLEALSRGAKFVYFVDISKASLAYVKSVCESFKIDKSSYKTILCKAETFLLSGKAEEQIDFVFTDPPYSANIVNKIVQSASVTSDIAPDAMIAAEYGSTNIFIVPDNMEIISERSFTIAKFSLLQRNSN